jgi:hypothetical protein
MGMLIYHFDVTFVTTRRNSPQEPSKVPCLVNHFPNAINQTKGIGRALK